MYQHNTGWINYPSLFFIIMFFLIQLILQFSYLPLSFYRIYTSNLLPLYVIKFFFCLYPFENSLTVLFLHFCFFCSVNYRNILSDVLIRFSRENKSKIYLNQIKKQYFVTINFYMHYYYLLLWIIYCNKWLYKN